MVDAENNTVIYEESFVDVANRIMQECGKGEAVAWEYFHSREEPQHNVCLVEPDISKSFEDDIAWKRPLYLHHQITYND